VIGLATIDLIKNAKVDWTYLNAKKIMRKILFCNACAFQQEKRNENKSSSQFPRLMKVPQLLPASRLLRVFTIKRQSRQHWIETCYLRFGDHSAKETTGRQLTSKPPLLYRQKMSLCESSRHWTAKSPDQILSKLPWKRVSSFVRLFLVLYGKGKKLNGRLYMQIKSWTSTH